MKLQWDSQRIYGDLALTKYSLELRNNGYGLIEYTRDGKEIVFTFRELEDLCKWFKRLIGDDERPTGGKGEG